MAAKKNTATKKASAKKAVAPKAAAPAKTASTRKLSLSPAQAPARKSAAAAKQTAPKAPVAPVKARKKVPVAVPEKKPARPMRPAPPTREPWQDLFGKFVRSWREQNSTLPASGGKKMARTFLKITRTADTHTFLHGLGLKQVPVIVENLGSVAAYTALVRMYEARPRNPIHEKIPLVEFQQRGQLVFTLQPGERKVIRVPYDRHQVNGTFIAMISDPLLDPNELTVADMSHRRILLVNLV